MILSLVFMEIVGPTKPSLACANSLCPTLHRRASIFAPYKTNWASGNCMFNARKSRRPQRPGGPRRVYPALRGARLKM